MTKIIDVTGQISALTFILTSLMTISMSLKVKPTELVVEPVYWRSLSTLARRSSFHLMTWITPGPGYANDLAAPMGFDSVTFADLTFQSAGDSRKAGFDWFIVRSVRENNKGVYRS
jgi:hypothetical protein